jgi:hypothetical protein
MKCEFCGKRARRYEVTVWDATWDWPIKTEVTKKLAFTFKIAKRLAKLGPNVGMIPYCRGKHE